ncbi:hypothetical protein E2542_SST01048 [Spatholobus suberectus]|nr:hypothetical protein E2542_SST01048 [Spatholobus suberectus]
MICLLQPPYADHLQVQTLNKMQREGRIRARTEDEQVIHPNPVGQAKAYKDSALEYPSIKHFRDPSSVYFAGADLRLGTNYW